MQIYSISWCFEHFSPQLWSEHLVVLFQWKVVLPENYAFLPKMPSCLGLIIAYTYNLDSSVFYEFDDKYKIYNFLIFWTFSLQLWSGYLEVLFQWKVVLPENHAVLPKMPILHIPQI